MSSTNKRVLAGTAAAAMALLMFGFVLFATAVTREHDSLIGNADGIVVLTGGELRVAEGARLLSLGKAPRLLISGVNPRTSRHDLHRLTKLTDAQFNCCVDLGYIAQDTVGNASETKAWVDRRRLTKLIVVTSSYHMPRGLAELAIEMPGVTLVPHPVTPRSMRQGAWWLNAFSTRVLLSEYVKFLPAAARLAAARLVRPNDDSSVAGRPAMLNGKI